MIKEETSKAIPKLKTIGRKEKPKPPYGSIIAIISLLIGSIVLLFTKNGTTSVITVAVSIGILWFMLLTQIKLRESAKIRKIEGVFPDFLELLASNLLAGITIDRALMLSSRKEFAPLDQEILRLGKDLVTGKDLEKALREMVQRTKSEKVGKTVSILISGIRAGGNIATLLQETATNMREKEFIEKRASSNILMYVIFIFFAIAIGGPMLFALSTSLVEMLTSILETIPAIDPSTTQGQIPLTLTQINISVQFINYFSLIFLVSTCLLGSMVLGVVNIGDEKEGLKYAISLIIISLIIYFIVRFGVSRYFSGFLG